MHPLSSAICSMDRFGMGPWSPPSSLGDHKPPTASIYSDQYPATTDDGRPQVVNRWPRHASLTSKDGSLRSLVAYYRAQALSPWHFVPLSFALPNFALSKETKLSRPRGRLLSTRTDASAAASTRVLMASRAAPTCGCSNQRMARAVRGFHISADLNSRVGDGRRQSLDAGLHRTKVPREAIPIRSSQV